MSKFKVGDRVRFVVNAGDRAGRVFSVVGLDRDGDPVIDDGECSPDCGHFSDWLELVEPLGDQTTLTRRDHFAMAALTGVMGSGDITIELLFEDEESRRRVSVWSYELADAMEAARNKEGAE